MSLDVAFFKKKINNLIDQSYQKGFILQNFFNETEIDLILGEFSSYDTVKPYFYGGYQDAELKRLIISSEEITNADFQIGLFKIDYPKRYYQLEHRMILGALLGLGIKREVIGDICHIADDFYFFYALHMQDFIKDNLRYIGNVPVSLIEVEKNLEFKREYIDKEFLVASLRIDVIIAAFYHLSRNEVLELIRDYRVKYNHKDCSYQATEVKEGDVISVRGKGRIIVLAIKNQTKSGKIKVDLRKPV